MESGVFTTQSLQQVLSAGKLVTGAKRGKACVNQSYDWFEFALDWLMKKLFLLSLAREHCITFLLTNHRAAIAKQSRNVITPNSQQNKEL